MSITDFFKRSFKIEDQDYLDLLDEIRAGLADHSLDYSMIHFICNAPKLPHWKNLPLLHFVQKLASNDNFDIVFRQVENLEAHIFKISVSICLAKHSPHFVIESLHGGIG